MNRLKKTSGVFLITLMMALAVSGPGFLVNAYAASPVIDGKNGWYFYSGDATIADYQGTDLFTLGQLELLRQRLVFTRDALAARGIEFILLLAPNKEHVYSEYMPDSYGSLAHYTRIQQVYEYLKNDLCVICPLEDLITASKKWPEQDFYYRTDTHWNDAGAYIAAKPLLQKLGISMLDFSELTVTTVPYNGLELAKLSGRDLPDTAPIISGFPDPNVTEESDYKSYYRYHTHGKDPRKVMLYGDSFSMSLSRIMSSEFNDIYAVYRGYEDPGLLGREQPDIVIYEVLERFLDTLFTYPLVP